MSELFMIEVSGMVVESLLPPLIILVPIIGSVLIGLAGLKSTLWSRFLAVIASALTLFFSTQLFMAMLQGYTVFYPLPALAGVDMSLKVDLTGSVFCLFSALIWFLATIASIPYMRNDKKQTRYYVFLILSLGGCLGVFLSGDFLSLFLFFELMTVSAYALVVHTQSDEAISAGANYLYLGIIGGLSLLSGIILLNTYGGTVVIAPLVHELIPLGGLAAVIAILMIAGFGVKAGMMPLHIWLPKAHPVAPAPASALLSGIMIKTGAYGIIRVVTMLYTPMKSMAESNLWYYTENLGHIIIWMGIMTMLLAAIMAVLQNNAKKLLAYSSISQMGYILMGIGAAAYLGFDGPMGFGGFSYHIINHAFFKSGLFILFGIIYTRFHDVRLDQLGGLWRRFPFTFAAFTVCAAGIMGIPGFNGYVSKTLLHHAIVEAFEHHHLWDLWVAEKLFMLTSGLTVCYIAKLTISIFFGPESPGLKAKLNSTTSGENWLEKFVSLSYIAAIVTLGLLSEKVIRQIIVPMAGTFTYKEYYLNYLAKTSVWVLPDLIGIAVALALGAGFYILFRKKELFSYKPPVYLSIEYSIFNPAIKMLKSFFTGVGRKIDDTINRGFHGTPASLVWVSYGVGYLDSQFLSRIGLRVVHFSETVFNYTYRLWMLGIDRSFGSIGQSLRKAFIVLFKFDYSARGDRRFQIFSTSNIDFDLYIVLIVIVIILASSLLYFL